MGSYVFDFLLDSVLFDSGQIETEYKALSDDEVRRELEKYSDHCAKMWNGMEVAIKRRALRMLSADEIDIRILKQSALYTHEIWLHDPALRLAMRALGAYATRDDDGVVRTPTLNRRALAKTMLQLSNITPMVASNYVQFIPMQLFHSAAAASTQLPALNEEILNAFRERAVVHPIRVQNGQITLLPAMQELEPCSSFYIAFDPNDSTFGMPVRLVSIPPGATIYPGDAVENTLPTKEEFQTRVAKVIEAAAANAYRILTTELDVSDVLETNLFTTRPLTYDLLQICSGMRTASRERYSTLLSLELPFLDNIETSVLMEIRRDWEVFQNFRSELDRRLREIQLAKDEDERQRKAADLAFDFSPGQLSSIGNEIHRLREKWIPGAITAVGAIAVAAARPDPSAAVIAATTAAGALGVVANAVVNYRAEKRGHPLYFLWKVLHESAQKSRTWK